MGTSFFILGMLISFALAIALSVMLDPGLGAMQSASGSDGSARWTVSNWSRTGVMLIASHRERAANWTPQQATGAPDARGGVDDPRAWASTTQDSQREWLELTYAQAVIPTSILVHESYMPGAVDRITAFSPDGEEIEVWRGQDPTPPGSGSGTSHFPVQCSFKTARVKVYLDSPSVAGWNEVDAVGITDQAGQLQWAIDCSASSSYGTPASISSGGQSVRQLAPSWSRLDMAQEPFRSHHVNSEDRVAKAAGFPMLALAGVAEAQTTIAAGAVPITSSISFAPLSTGPSPTTVPPILPLHPIWIRLLVDSAFWALVAGGLYWLTVIPRRFIQELSRMRRGCCIKCGYQLGYDFRRGCPDCGWGRNGELPPARGDES